MGKKKTLKMGLNALICEYGLPKVCQALESVKDANGYVDTDMMGKYLTPRQVERAQEERDIYDLYASSGMGKCEFLEYYNQTYGKNLNRQRLYYIIRKESERVNSKKQLIRERKKR